MSRQPYTENRNEQKGITISGTIDGNNRLPASYSTYMRGNNRPLDANYRNKAFGSGRTENPYKNNYKNKFDSRYPSIWRSPTAVNFIRRLDEWEKSALSAALGVPWIPPPPPTISAGPAPSPSPSPATDTVGPVANIIIYGPTTVRFNALGFGYGSTEQSGGAIVTSDTDVDLYVADNGSLKNYFIKNSDGVLLRLNQVDDSLQIIDPETTEHYQADRNISSINDDITNNIIPLLNNETDIGNVITETLNSNIYDTTFKLNLTDNTSYNILYDNNTSQYFISKGSNEYVLTQYNQNEDQAIFGESADNSYIGSITNDNGNTSPFLTIPSTDLQLYNLYVKKRRIGAVIQNGNVDNPDGNPSEGDQPPPPQGLTVYTTNFTLVTDANPEADTPSRILNIKYCSNPSLFYITDSNGGEYEINPIDDNNNSSQAYYNLDTQQILNIKNGDIVITYQELLDAIPNIIANNNPIQSDEIRIIRIDGSTIPSSETTGGKYKKNKNKSRRFKKHFRKTRKSHKE